MADPIILNPADSVAVLATSARKGDDPLGLGAALPAPLPAGHKLARIAMAKGAPVIKFGQFIGSATEDIPVGAHVHSHNCTFAPHDESHAIGADLAQAEAAVSALSRSFMGYRRDDGRVGTRNYIALCATVNCSATVIRKAAQELEAEGALAPYARIDGVIALAHGTGCGMAATGRGADYLDRVLWGHATHPNVGAAVFVGLGCEVMQIERMRAHYGSGQPARFHALTIQATGGTRATIEAIKAHVRGLLPLINQAEREPCPVSELRIGLQCGGSDGFSGITANPALGVASDMIVGCGGTVILSETPEIHGAEGLLLRRTTPDVAERLIACLNWWEDYAAQGGGSLDNNPSPGNKAGGITTILEKSLGAVAKAGATPLRAYYDYAEQVTQPGLVFMDSPGYDPVSATGQIAGGAQLIVFTTGRGSAFGSKPAPTLKLSTSDRLFDAMQDDMDLNCGDILSQGVSLTDKGAEIFEAILRVASGEPSKSETLGLGDFEFVPWQVGAVM
ncbi:altronate dehydratase family protein [Sinirhodobacter sp. WL0062]|uniref:Altronate dehydratase family protein n=1 Tax=Rhodobacter flavimaris TaxID=2907145 RepID=A0ABS8Z388_9RHOB|nr:altronate dehydratase family protein [Sinirhodobacter sp. WL0062]MCE5975131.1 altronate dehydratase family protein [Sinirhodobacter sp. WL0062]